MSHLTLGRALAMGAIFLQAACASDSKSTDASSPPAHDASTEAAVSSGADAATTTDARPPAGSDASDAPPPAAGKVAIFIGQGSLGRTIVSCDDGKTWVGNRAWDSDGDPLLCGGKQTAVCYTGSCSYSIDGQCVKADCCNDTPDVAKGVVQGNGQFVATWGWGRPGAVRASTDGIGWVTTHPKDTFGGVAFGGGRFVLASRFPFWSADGTQWTAGKTADFRDSGGGTIWSVRRFAYADVAGGGRFVAVASGDKGGDILVSSDGGDTWWRPRTIPPGCDVDSFYGGIVSGNGVIVIVNQAANACRSTDGGDTWSVAPTGLGEILSHGVWTGSQFLFWGDDKTMASSPDGVKWAKTALATPMRIGPVARGDSGTLVALGSVWNGYDKQSFMRSTDGITWETLPANLVVQGHPLFYLTFGHADPSTICPGH